MTDENDALTLRAAQEEVDRWIQTIGVRYFSELTNLAQLVEEVGERPLMKKKWDECMQHADPSVFEVWEPYEVHSGESTGVRVESYYWFVTTKQFGKIAKSVEAKKSVSDVQSDRWDRNDLVRSSCRHWDRNTRRRLLLRSFSVPEEAENIVVAEGQKISKILK